MTPIQGKHLISSGSTGYFSNSDKISGRTFDRNNEQFFSVYVCHFFLSILFFILYLHPPAAVIISFKKRKKKRSKFGILHLRIFWQRKVPVGLHFPRSWQDRGCRAQLSLCHQGPCLPGAATTHQFHLQ